MDYTMNKDEIKTKLIELEPKMNTIIDFQEKSDLRYCQLTPAGIVIAICNLNLKYGYDIKLNDYLDGSSKDNKNF